MKLLEAYGIPFGKEGQAQLYTTDSGLVIGIYCSGKDLAPNKTKALNAIQQLIDDGAEYIICAFHWGRSFTTSRTRLRSILPTPASTQAPTSSTAATPTASSPLRNTVTA